METVALLTTLYLTLMDYKCNNATEFQELFCLYIYLALLIHKVFIAFTIACSLAE